MRFFARIALAKGVDLEFVARVRTSVLCGGSHKSAPVPNRPDSVPGCSSADLAHLVNVAAVSSAKTSAPQAVIDDNGSARFCVQGTPGFSGADLANLVNVAAIKAARDDVGAVTQAAIEYAKDRIMMGAERKSAFISDDNRRLTAYHEGGHALVAMLTRGASPVHKATIMPRGQALGMVMQLPDKDSTSVTRRQLQVLLPVLWQTTPER